MMQCHFLITAERNDRFRGVVFVVADLANIGSYPSTHDEDIVCARQTEILPLDDIKVRSGLCMVSWLIHNTLDRGLNTRESIDKHILLIQVFLILCSISSSG